MEDILNIQSDVHCEEDQLGFDPYVQTIAKMVTDKNFKTPFCIGIYGKWGSGKTSFMRLLEKRLLKGRNKPIAVPVWFNPWRYEKEEHLIIPFLKTMELELKSQRGSLGEKLVKCVGGAAQRLGEAASAFAYGVKAGGKIFSLDVSKMAMREEELSSRRLEETKSIADRLSSLYYNITKELKEVVKEKDFRIVVFIDDLDRCQPEKAVELLEAIKLFLDIPGYLFIMGVDRDVVKKGIAHHYRFFEHKEEKAREDLIISPEDYLEKMIQLPLELPSVEAGRKRKYIESLLGGEGEAKAYKDHADIIEIGVGDNPRSLKRFVNLLAFTSRLAGTVKDNIVNKKEEPQESLERKELLKKYFAAQFYIKWCVIVYKFPKEYNNIKGNKRRLLEIQKEAIKEPKKEVGRLAGEDKTLEEKQTEKGTQVEEALKKILSMGNPFPLPGEEGPPSEADVLWLIERFVHLMESTVVEKKEKRMGGEHGLINVEPGRMVRIPKGEFLYGDGKIKNNNIKNDFYIDVFPVTNGQYKKFLDANAEHRAPTGDSEEVKPYCWIQGDDEKWAFPKGTENHPVVLVSYNDAVAFCEWRSREEGLTGEGIYRLPTEEEWEKAARGEDGRKYPWGDELDIEWLNCSDRHVGRPLKDYEDWKKTFMEDFFKKNQDKVLTTEVGRFSGGVSPFGCFDMAGNVWEWTDSWYDKEEKYRPLRGGSWIDNASLCRCAYRYGDRPGDRDVNVGFRCARTLIL